MPQRVSIQSLGLFSSLYWYDSKMHIINYNKTIYKARKGQIKSYINVECFKVEDIAGLYRPDFQVTLLQQVEQVISHLLHYHSLYPCSCNIVPGYSNNAFHGQNKKASLIYFGVRAKERSWLYDCVYSIIDAHLLQNLDDKLSKNRANLACLSRQHSPHVSTLSGRTNR